VGGGGGPLTFLIALGCKSLSYFGGKGGETSHQ